MVHRAFTVVLTVSVLNAGIALGADYHEKPVEPAFPNPFRSTPVLSANMPLTRAATRNGVTLTFSGGQSPATAARMYDPRLFGSAYYGLISQEVNHFNFTAIRTNRSGRDVSTAYLSAKSYNNRWTPRHPRSGAVYSRNGFQIDFKRDGQVLYTYATGNRYSGNLNICGQVVDKLTINPFEIPNDVFEATNNIEFRGQYEFYLGCP